MGGRGIAGLVGLCRNYFDRFRNDNIDINAFSQAGAGEAALVRVFDQYTNALQIIGPEVMDFAGPGIPISAMVKRPAILMGSNMAVRPLR